MLCEGSTSVITYTACRDYYRGLGHPVDYATCSGCGLVQQHPRPDDVSPFYENYPVHAQRSVFQRLARRYLQRQVYHRPECGAGSMTLLDYGCGDGVYLVEMRDQYKTLVGYEPGVCHASTLSGRLNIPIYSDPELLAATWEDKVDVVTAHYVLEHVVDLHHTFRLFQRVLKAGGLLYIAVPNIHSWESRLFRRAWHGLDPPRHICFPNLNTFNVLADEYGFQPTRKAYAAFPNTLSASIATVCAGKFNPALFNLMILPSWLIALLAPSGTEIFEMRKLGSS